VSTAGKFLALVGPKKKPQDRRRLWAREDREYKGWENLSRGERKRRDKFARLIANGADPVEAIRATLELKFGHIPEVETPESFEETWATDVLAEIANRWMRSPYFRRFTQEAIRAGQSNLAASSGLLTKTIIDIATDEKASKAVRVKAAAVGLSLVGLVPGSKIEEEVGDKKKALVDKVRGVLRVVPKTGTDGVPA
jgi:hypothetical protein